MKKLLSLFLTLMLVISLSACGGSTTTEGEVVTDVTWQELLAANAPDRVFEQASNYKVVTELEDLLHEEYNAYENGQLTYSYGFDEDTTELIDGIEYDAPVDGTKSMTIMAPGADLFDFSLTDYSQEFVDYETDGKVYKDGDLYFVNFKEDVPDFGYTSNIVVYFHATSFLIERIENTTVLADEEMKMVKKFSYDVEEPTFNSYNRVTGAEDLVNLSIHYPDGTTKELAVARDVTIVVYYPNYEEEWSVCRDEACTESIFDLSWVDGNEADLYLCEGYVKPAAPELDYVIKNSTIEAMYKRDNHIYAEETYVEDLDYNLIAYLVFSYYENEETGPNLNYEVQDENYEVLRANAACDGVWYAWTGEEGYSVDFYHDFSYVKELMKDYPTYIHIPENAEILYDEDSTYYYIPTTEEIEDGTKEIKYWIGATNHVDRIEETLINHEGEYAYITTYVGSPSPILGSMDLMLEMSAPSDEVEVVELTVVSSAGEKTLPVRVDAKISFEGDALFSDEACTNIVTDLTWVEGGQATVYTQK